MLKWTPKFDTDRLIIEVLSPWIKVFLTSGLPLPLLLSHHDHCLNVELVISEIRASPKHSLK